MPGLTPNFFIPYPCAGETITPAVFQNFANGVESALSTVDALNAQAVDRPRASMYNGTGLSIATTVLTTMTYPTVEFADGVTTSATTFTITQAGVYEVSVWFQMQNIANNNDYWLGQILRNGVIQYRRKLGDPVVTPDRYNSITGLLICNVADTLTTQYQWQGAGGPVLINARFGIRKMCDL